MNILVLLELTFSRICISLSTHTVMELFCVMLDFVHTQK